MRAKPYITSVTLTAAALLAALFVSCANQSPPGGGPEDKEPPAVLESSPQSGAVNVDPRSRVNVIFSEWVNLAGIAGAVAVYPPPPGGVDVKARKNRLTVIPKEPLGANTTYHIVINTALKDLRGNSPTTPINIIFSTGAELDSGKLDGRVVSDKRFTVLPRAALFRDDGEWSDTSYFSAPDYTAHSDSSGVFSFSHLREGKYRLIAFSPQGRAGRMRLGDECFSPMERVIEVTKADTMVTLYPTDSDTLGPRVDSVAAVSPRALYGRWNKAFSVKERSQPKWVITSLAAGVDSAAAMRVGEQIALLSGTGFYLMLHDSLASGAYKIKYTYGETADSLRFETPDVYDTLQPKMVRHIYGGAGGGAPELRLIWSRPVQMSVDMAMAVDAAASDTVAFMSVPGYSDTTRLTPIRRLMPGASYRVSITPGSIKDALGRAAFVDTAKSIKGGGGGKTKGVDSIGDIDTNININTNENVNANINTTIDTAITPITIDITIRTLPADSLCYRLHGGAECLEPNAARRWVYRPLTRGDETYTAIEKNGAFSFDTIPASKGTLLWFIDTNNDNRVTRGRLAPWRPPEPFFAVPDTVEAKARWEIEGLKARGCPE